MDVPSEAGDDADTPEEGHEHHGRRHSTDDAVRPQGRRAPAGASAARSGCRCRRSRPPRTRSSRPRCSAPTSGASGPSRCPGSSGWPASTTCRSTSCCPPRSGSTRRPRRPLARRYVGPSHHRPREARQPRGARGRPAEPVLPDDPGPAPGLQRQDAHDAPRRPRGHRRHPRHADRVRRAGRLDELGLRLELHRRVTAGRPVPARPSAGSASTSTSRSAPTAATTAPSPPGPTVTTCSARYLAARGHGSRHRSRRATARRPRACSSAAARRRWYQPGRARRPCSTPCPWRARRRGHGRVQPRHVTRRAAGRLRAPRRHPHQLGRAVDGAAVLAALGRTPRPGQRRARRARPSGVGFASFNVDLIYGAAGESLDDWQATLDAALALDPPHVSAYGLTVEAGTPLADDAGPPSRRRRPGRQVRAGRRASRRRRPGRLRDLELGPTRPRVPAQPPLLDAGRLRRLRLRGPLPPGRPAVVERAHARALSGRHRDGHVAGRRRGAARRRHPPHRGSAARSADAGGRAGGGVHRGGRRGARRAARTTGRPRTC